MPFQGGLRGASIVGAWKDLASQMVCASRWIVRGMRSMFLEQNFIMQSPKSRLAVVFAECTFEGTALYGSGGEGGGRDGLGGHTRKSEAG